MSWHCIGILLNSKIFSGQLAQWDVITYMYMDVVKMYGHVEWCNKLISTSPPPPQATHSPPNPPNPLPPNLFVLNCDVNWNLGHHVGHSCVTGTCESAQSGKINGHYFLFPLSIYSYGNIHDITMYHDKELKEQSPLP